MIRKKVYKRLAVCSSKVVERSPFHYQVEGSSQATAASTEREKMNFKKSLAEFFEDIKLFLYMKK